MVRPRIDLTDDQVVQVEKLAAVLTQEQIADFLGISERTLRNRIKDDERVLAAYARGRARAIHGVATNLVQQAEEGNVNAAKFYLETQAGWRPSLDIRAPDGPFSVVILPAKDMDGD